TPMCADRLASLRRPLPLQPSLPRPNAPLFPRPSPVVCRIHAQIKGRKVVAPRARLSCHRGDEALEDSIAYRRIRLPAALAEVCEWARSSSSPPRPHTRTKSSLGADAMVRFDVNEMRSPARCAETQGQV